MTNTLEDKIQMAFRNKVGSIVTDLVFGSDRTQQGIDYGIQAIVDELDHYLKTKIDKVEFAAYKQGLEAGKIIAKEQERQHIKLCAKEQSCSVCMEYIGSTK